MVLTQLRPWQTGSRPRPECQVATRAWPGAGQLAAPFRQQTTGADGILLWHKSTDLPVTFAGRLDQEGLSTYAPGPLGFRIHRRPGDHWTMPDKRLKLKAPAVCTLIPHLVSSQVCQAFLDFQSICSVICAGTRVSRCSRFSQSCLGVILHRGTSQNTPPREVSAFLAFG